MNGAKSISTPMDASHDFSPSSLNVCDPHAYRQTLGKLQYLALTRPNIAFSINMLAQIVSDPTDSHWRPLNGAFATWRAPSCMVCLSAVPHLVPFVPFSTLILLVILMAAPPLLLLLYFSASSRFLGAPGSNESLLDHPLKSNIGR